jgi:hypothetical protein
MRPALVVLILSVTFSLAAQTSAAQTSSPGHARIVQSYGKLPLAFEANQGQSDPQVKFFSRGAGYSLFLTSNEAVLTLRDNSRLEPASHVVRDRTSSERASAVLRMKLVGANANAKVLGQDELSGKSNYFIGNNPKKWHSNVEQFAKVRYESVYPGVDLVYYGNQRELEYDFVLQPGANPEAIRLRIDGASKLRIQRDDLILTSPAGDVDLRSPSIYQEANGIRKEVHGRYIIRNGNEVGFAVADYDRRRALIIDPVLAYSTYLGGSGVNGDHAFGIAVDSEGNAYVTGQTCSADFPTGNSIQAYAGNCDVFVTKLNPDGSALVYSTFLGGSDSEGAGGIALDAAGNVYVTGATFSTDFPAVNAIQSTSHGNDDGFVTQISATGNALIYSTYLGGHGDDQGTGIAVDSAGNACVVGNTESRTFPTKNAIQPTFGGGTRDAFVTKINPNGSAFVYSTYLGGNDDDYGAGIALDGAGNAYIAGSTLSTNFPTQNPIQPALSGVIDAFVTEINSAGTSLVYSTYLGGSGWDQAFGVAADATGNAYVTGNTQSTDFPTSNAIQNNLGSSKRNAFVSKINPAGSAFVYSTYLGGNNDELGYAITADAAGSAFATGASADPGGAENIFVTNINAGGSAIVYSSELGAGCNNNVGSSIAVDLADSAYVAGWTCANSFPTTPFAFQKTFKGGAYTNAIVAKIAGQTFLTQSATKLAFTVQMIGHTGPRKKITLTNSGSHTLTINQISLAGPNAGDFAQTNTCGSALAAGASCTISVTFTPLDKNQRVAMLEISDSDPASPQAVSLSGIGTVVSLSAKKLSFGNQPVGTTSPPQSVTLTNLGSTPLNFFQIAIRGPNRSDFSATNTCQPSIGANASCTITVIFRPTGAGARNAGLVISDDGGGSPQRVHLLGTGT